MVAGRVERAADHGHLAVHHRAGRDHVRARVGVRHGGGREARQRGVEVDAAARVQLAAVAVARVLAQAHVGDDEQPRRAGLDRADGARHGAGGVVRVAFDRPARAGEIRETS